MVGFELGFQLGMLHGYAIGISIEQQRIKSEKKTILRQEDMLIMDYIKSKSIVYMDDVLGYLGWDGDTSNRRAVGHAMGRLGWDRRRGHDKRWYYTRGTKAVAYVEPLS